MAQITGKGLKKHTSTCAILVLLCLVETNSLKAQTSDEIIGAWELRLKEIIPCKLSFKIHSVDNKARYFSENGNESSQPAQQVNSQQDGVIEYDQRVVMSFESGKLRYESTGQQPFENASLVKQDILATTNQEFSKRLDRSLGTISNLDGEVSKEPKNIALHLTSTLPIRWLFRIGEIFPSKTDLNLLLTKATVDRIESVDCIMLKTDPEQSVVSYYWLDPRKGLSIIRHSVKVSGSVKYQIDCSYEQKQGVWLPKRWVVVHFDSGGKTSSVKECELESVQRSMALPSDEFDLTFPVGTIVSDNRESPPLVYLQREDQRKRVITQAEQTQSYDEIAATETGGAESHTSSPVRLRIIANVGLLLAIAVMASLLIYRRRMRKNQFNAEVPEA